MSDSSRRPHGLEYFLQSQRPPGGSEAGVDARILDGVNHINLRGDVRNTEFRNCVENALGQPLPVKPNTLSNGEHHVYWLGPDEWLIVSTATEASGLAGSLENTLKDVHASVNDISGGQVTLRLTGDKVRDVLTKGCTIDFHTDVFKPRDCAQSGLAKASVLIGCIAQPGTFELIVRRSFAEYLAQWLQHAARDCGIEFR